MCRLEKLRHAIFQCTIKWCVFVCVHVCVCVCVSVCMLLVTPLWCCCFLSKKLYSKSTQLCINGYLVSTGEAKVNCLCLTQQVRIQVRSVTYAIAKNYHQLLHRTFCYESVQYYIIKVKKSLFTIATQCQYLYSYMYIQDIVFTVSQLLDYYLTFRGAA